MGTDKKEEADLVMRVAQAARGSLAAPQADLAERFTRLYYDGADPQELAERDLNDLVGAAAAHLDFGRRHAGGAAKVHVFNPRLEEHGWQSTHTVVQIVSADMPFLVDSATMEINRQGLAQHLVIHPVLRVVRDAKGKLQDVARAAATGNGRLESFMCLEIDRQTDPARLQEIGAGLQRALADVAAAVADWQPMRQCLRALIDEIGAAKSPLDAEEVREAHAFLSWLLDNHITLLGYRDYDLVTEGGEDVLRIVPGSGLGILREREGTTVSTSFATLPPETRARARKPEILVLSKANARATVHRPGYLDYVGVKRFDDKGRVIGERRILGLYTHNVYTANVAEIPVVRRKVAAVHDRAGFLPTSHNGKAFSSILEDYPRDELMQIEPEELYAFAIAILQLGARQRTRLLARRDAYGRFVTCMVYVPREKFSTEQRQRIQRILAEAYNGTAGEFNVSLSESPLARIFILVRTPGGVPEVDAHDVEARIVAATRRWEDDLHALLVEHLGEENGNRLYARYGSAFPAGYREDHPVRSALPDIEMMDALGAPHALGMNLYRPLAAEPGVLRFRLFRSGAPVVLSDALPILEHLGARVLDDLPYHIEPADGDAVWIIDFGLALPVEAEVVLERVRPLFHEAFDAMWCGRVEPDSLNQLVLAAALSAREIAILRAYSRYLRQTGFTFSLAYVQQTLVAHPALSRALVNLFNARFDPKRASAEAQEALVREIEEGLDQVPSLDEDRILRRFLAAISATTRTNAFQPDGDGRPKSYVSLKFDPSKVPELPEPRPKFEIFVYSPRVEGVHLRGGSVARGGLRWSDRREDFRTEVLGLMKAQMVKNAVIVPVGSKGGFVLKQPPPAGDREALMREGVECYKTFLCGLLDITDNLVDGKPAPPANVLRHDGDDPYLVVAADKGTATFSDIANGVAQKYGFWLGDAFASGGSVGYDHKQMGITARGAWESVKRHFRELGLDTQSQPFTVAGIGDMSGDVFGNGMLLSRQIRLVAAFDHRHVFIDPEPDAEASFRERERLFKLPRSSWADYDAKLISKGGGIWPRSAKSIPLPPEAQRVLGVDAKSLAPNELVSAILKAQVDLLYNGGIGTYVKSSRESHAQVGDRANDALRIDGRDLRCKVVAEGGNLGLTHLGRIEYALAGGRIYTDAIDNSAGVDCSDHEVNIKILLDAAVREGELTLKQRNRQLAELTDEVAALVLRDNTFQTQSLSVTGRIAPQLLEQQARFIRALERAGRLNRAIEFLPSDDEIAERKAARLGLTAPERAVLLAYSKMQIYDELLASDIPEEPTIATALERYFPKALRQRYERQIQSHQLRREIIATHVTNSMVNRVGSTFVNRMREETGARTDEVVRAYLVTRDAFGMVPFWQQVEALDLKIADDVQSAMLIDAGRLIVRVTLWLLRNRRHLGDIASAIGYFQPGIERLGAMLPHALAPSERQGYDQTSARYVEAGAPDALAALLAGFDTLPAALDLVEVGDALGRDVESVAQAYFALGGWLEFPWLRTKVASLPSASHWQTLAKAALRDDLAGMQRQLTADALRSDAGKGDAQQAIAAWEQGNRPLLERCRQVHAELRAHKTLDLAMISVAMKELRNIAAHA
ncbi:MAG: NAD-glutamate dehydrogenase [Burkholderiales bacterium]|nr:NAD-glutamate dehydrogenase [Burkholderiales bacterium]